jgi:hypothetical protein
VEAELESTFASLKPRHQPRNVTSSRENNSERGESQKETDLSQINSSNIDEK